LGEFGSERVMFGVIDGTGAAPTVHQCNDIGPPRIYILHKLPHALMCDLVVLSGNPAQNIEDIENVQTVFKDGVGFDPAKLIQSEQGLVGQR
jgi:hypothetical protein